MSTLRARRRAQEDRARSSPEGRSPQDRSIASPAAGSPVRRALGELQEELEEEMLEEGLAVETLEDVEDDEAFSTGTGTPLGTGTDTALGTDTDTALGTGTALGTATGTGTALGTGPALATSAAEVTGSGTDTDTGTETEADTVEEPVRQARPEGQLAEADEEAFGDEEVEAALDQILTERTVAGEPEAETADRAGGRAAARRGAVEGELVTVPPRQADEFLCSGCFLVMRRELLADPERGLCRDCAA